MPKSYGEPDADDRKGGGMKQDKGDARLSSKQGWKVPDGMPDPPGETGKIPRPE